MIAMVRAAVDGPARPERGNRRLPQFLHMIVVAGAALIGELRGGAEADAQHRRQCSRPKPCSCPPP